MVLLQSTYDLWIFYTEIQKHSHRIKSCENCLHYFLKDSSKKVKKHPF